MGVLGGKTARYTGSSARSRAKNGYGSAQNEGLKSSTCWRTVMMGLCGAAGVSSSTSEFVELCREVQPWAVLTGIAEAREVPEVGQVSRPVTAGFAGSRARPEARTAG